jgi:eukaryotic-like serine/threonine-protein kinase
MARIYIARSTGIGSFERHVVLKMILPERAQDETSVQMFLDEARLAASLNHQNVAQVFEVGKEAGIHFLAMEYVHGQDLRALLAKAGSAGTRVPLELALTVVAGAAAGLDHAHERRTTDGVPMGIVHRDVSPSNIMIGYDGAVKLLDFGIAKAAARSVETQSGIIKGKFAYMAPEQCRGRDVDRRSDVFSLGIILYEVSTQHRCFRADSDFDTMHRIVTSDIVRPTRLVQGYPQALEAIVMKALAVDPGQRYQSAGLLLEALESFATTSRLSLSTMALGRFMRDMFGQVPEPWLVTGGFNRVAPPKEQTISSTNASGDAPRLHPPPPSQRSSASAPALQGPPPSGSFPAVSPPGRSSPGALRPSPPALSAGTSPGAQRPPSSSLSSPALHRPSSPSSPGTPPPRHEEAPMHLPPDLPLELPGGGGAAEAPGWSSQGYAAMAPAQVAAATPSPDLLPPDARGPSPGPGMSTLGPHVFNDARSEFGPAHPAMHHRAPHGTQPIARTRQGYDSAPAMSRSELSPRFDAHELEGNISLQPSKRLLYVGIGVVLVGIIVLLGISIMDNRDEAPAPPPSPSQGASSSGDRDPGAAGGAPGAAPLRPQAVKPEAFRAESAPAAAPAAGSSDPAPRRATIHLRVVSTPPGAEVSLSGKPLGITPLEVDIERRSGSEPLTIHRARYQDVTAALDLGNDYDQTVALAPLAEPGAAKPASAGASATSGSSGNAGSSGTERDGRSTGKSAGADHDPRPAHPAGRDGSAGKRAAPSGLPPKEDCQPPDKFNPYEAACHGHVCKPCPVSTR